MTEPATIAAKPCTCDDPNCEKCRLLRLKRVVVMAPQTERRATIASKDSR